MSWATPARRLSGYQGVAAAQRAIQINPANAHIPNALQKMAPREVIAPDRLALLTSKYWGREGVRLGPPGAPFAGKWQQLDGNADSAALAVAPGHLYQIHHSGSIWEFTG
jgi:hypothetical protein